MAGADALALLAGVSRRMLRLVEGMGGEQTQWRQLTVTQTSPIVLGLQACASVHRGAGSADAIAIYIFGRSKVDSSQHSRSQQQCHADDIGAHFVGHAAPQAAVW